MRPRLRSLRRHRVLTAVALVVAVVAVAVVAGVASGDDEPRVTSQDLRVAGVPEPGGPAVELDARLYLPEALPDEGGVPGVLLAHGYGGTKDSVAAQARTLAARGYAVLTWSARGFGRSGGLIHLDSPDFEVRDATLLLDALARRPEVRRDAAGDPRVGVVGASYGGGLALLLAGTDRRVDAVVASITWNDLRQALFPQFATAGPPPTTPAGVAPTGGTGVFKRQWTAVLLQSSLAAGLPQGAATGPDPASGLPDPPSGDLEAVACGRLAADLCRGYVRTATGGRPDQGLLDLLAASSPARVASRITAPTMLIQGQTDSLFPLSEADANARAIASAGTDVSVVWGAGGHDGGTDESERLEQVTADFLDRRIGGGASGDGSPEPPGFQVTVPDAAVSSTDANPVPQSRSAARFPGLPQGGAGGGAAQAAGLRFEPFDLRGGTGIAVSPPGATPSALTSLPGAGGALSLLGGASGAAASAPGGGGGTTPGAAAGGGGLSLGVLPGQSATFETAPLERPVRVVGSPRVALRIASTARDATLFASLLDVDPSGRTTLPRQLVSPVRLEGLAPGADREVTVALPAIVRDVAAGHRLRVVLASTDQGYAVPPDARAYQVRLAGDRSLLVPTVPLRVEAAGGTRALWIAAGLLAAAAAATVLAFALWHRRLRRRTVTDVDGELAVVPLSITGLGKAYGDGFRAVSDLSFEVRAGQVLGLLGPNGAGKTTTLRMLVGLILPSEGEIRIFGRRVTPGAAVLSRLGSFIENPGFLPHLSGRDNLQLYWRATGRPADEAKLATALEVAGLDDDIERTVRTYSQGMRQRLAIAQAMLGLPDLLVLDEPTNGLDPPQIREMREVLSRYAATGRTVLVSSHLLAEVEQTCTHVVVMARGRLVAQGPVEDLVGAARTVLVDVDDPARAALVAQGVDGVRDVRPNGAGLRVSADGPARGALVRALVEAGVEVERIAPQRGLEETFLHLIGEEG